MCGIICMDVQWALGQQATIIFLLLPLLPMMHAEGTMVAKAKALGIEAVSSLRCNADFQFRIFALAYCTWLAALAAAAGELVPRPRCAHMHHAFTTAPGVRPSE